MPRTLVWFSGGVSAIVLGTTAALGGAPQSTSIGEAGIDALRLHIQPYNLIGRKIAIGQVEIGRPGQFGIDKAVTHNRTVPLTRVFFRDSPARMNANVDGHAQNVASIMISAAKGLQGVAPGARLYSSAAGTPKRYGQPEECLSAQYVAEQNGGDVRAINFSFGEALRQDPRPNATLDGNALLTQCIDWSTRVHNVLYVIAGNQGKGGISIPTDNFNGINVAFTTRLDGVFRKLDFANLGDASGSGSAIAGIESNIGPRRAIGLVAPGNDVSLVTLNGNLTTSSGTSFAAPHVTATVALLQEYGDRQLRQSCKQPGCSLPWTLDARREQVMKAVLLNSADKIKDTGDGLALGMSRTILDKNNRSWLESDAYSDRKLPLDTQMGVGQLNAFRAYQQFSAGQYLPGAAVPAIGWDYRTVEVKAKGERIKEKGEEVEDRKEKGEAKKVEADAPSFRDYVLEKPLQQGSFVSATLVWNRLVDLVDKNDDREFDIGESFHDRGLNTLTLYLMRVEDTDVSQSIWSGISDVDSVQHIFHPVPATGRYKLRVQFQRQVNEPIQPYALAWWTVPAR
ncbi:peptidase S8 and S53 subtilisin kexin sedolisin [Stenomitos frigidus ULC18]|uniref:Peptidase S8 and S53 subtilisin kexin sedolisin n=1 Tax=Stenomitos frigidus ULC18 TaxID=2107698 RepID=A0A2T1DZF8_9CYAN|nr:peptidase S8 and S53 subtilisin kexin sedolisin [Stenomitos frigidus ULC18]